MYRKSCAMNQGKPDSLHGILTKHQALISVLLQLQCINDALSAAISVLHFN